MSLVSRITAVVTEIAWHVKNIYNTKVDKAAGKGLSTNDFSNTYLSDIDKNSELVYEVIGGGYLTGGVLTPTGGVNFQISPGSGYARDVNGKLTKVTWGILTGSCLFNGSNYIGIDYTGSVIVENDHINPESIPIGYFNTYNSNTAVAGFSNIRFKARNMVYNVNEWVRHAIGSLVQEGCSLSLQASPDNLKVVLTSGSIWSQYNNLTINQTSDFVKLFNSLQGYVPDSVTTANTITTDYYNVKTNNYATALQPMTAGYYTKHLFFINPEGSLFMLYGDAQFDNLDEAKKAPAPEAPADISASICRVATVIVQQGNGVVVQLKDTRPIIARLFQEGVAASLLTSVSHATLTDLQIGDPHTQYLNTTRGDLRYPTITDLNTLLSAKANLDSPTFINNPTAPTKPNNSNDSSLATTQFVTNVLNAAIANLTNGAPELLNQLNEFANAINNDPSYATTIANELATKLSFTISQALTSGQKLIAKTNLDLQNVDNTSDANKALSTAAVNALAGKVNNPAAVGIMEYLGSGNSAGRSLLGTTNQINITVLGNGNYQWSIAPNPVLAGTDAVTVPNGSTAQRGAIAVGKFRFNSELVQWEGVRNGVWAPIGKIIQVVTGVIPVQSGTARQFYDNQAPAITSGFSIFTTSITPYFANSKIYLNFQLMVDHSINNRNIVTIVVINGTTLVGVKATNSYTAGRPASQGFQIALDSLGAGVPINIDVRVGANGSGTTYINRGFTATMGNTGASHFKIEEVV